MEYWGEAADEHYDNELIEQKYQVLNQLYQSSLTFVLGGVISSIISGIVFMAFATIIDLLRKLVEINQQQNAS